MSTAPAVTPDQAPETPTPTPIPTDTKTKTDASPEAEGLTSKQSAALFNIITHYETYAEFAALKHPGTIANYGHPFDSSVAPSSSESPLGSRPSPVLQTLLRRFLLTLPGARDFPPEFWSVRIQGLLTRFAEGDLSESYDKGSLGTRKTLSTAFATMIEAVVRGCLGGCPPSPGEERPDRTPLTAYDHSKAEDLERAFNDTLHAAVYGTLLDDLTEWLSESDDFEGQSPMLTAAVEYEILHIATLFHQVFILSTEGQYLLKLIENIHGMLPYSVVRQTLRVSNAATMITGMLRLFLSKLSVGGLTNYFGLTKNAADGMNLLQRIISVVLSWDSAEFKKKIDRIEKDSNGPSKACLSALRDHVQGPSSVHATAREKSRKESKSIVAVILESADPALVGDLSEENHAQCQEYLTMLLSNRDRDVITRVFCTQAPDLFTQTIRDAVGGYEPYIRAVHDKVDLREHVTDYQSFVDQFIATSKPKKVQGKKGEATERLPSVEDYVALLRKNKHMLYRWLHLGAKLVPDVRDTFLDWAKEAMVHFRKPGVPIAAKGSSVHAEGSVQEQLAAVFATISDEQKTVFVPILDAQAEYLDKVATLSRDRIQKVINGKSETMAGPGAFLVMWQDLLDQAELTPASAKGPVRHGRDMREDTSQDESGEGAVAGAKEAAEALGELPQGPDVRALVEAMGPAFQALVASTEEGGDERSDISID